MSKVTSAASIKKQISETRAKIKKLREGRRSGFAALMESELEKSAIVLAAKDIVEKLQNMAEDLAQVEAKDMMELEGSLKTEFGESIATGFSTATTNALRSALDAIKASKDAITTEIARMEAVVNGEPVNDMAMTPPPVPGDDAGLDDVDGLDAGDDALAAPEDDLGPDADADADLGADADLDSPENSLAAGRARKDESVAFRNAKNPDKFILEAFKRALKEGVAPRTAASRIANTYGIDVIDVREIVKEGLRTSPFSK